MANKIQIKRSTTNAAPTGLASGELAYTSNGEILFLGHPDGTTGSIAIGGRRVPGTLTANQALVANSTLGIDKVVVANLTPTQIFANSGVGNAGQVLTSGATGNVYWSTPVDVSYDLLTVANVSLGVVRLDPSSGTDDDIRFIGAGGVTVTSDGSGNVTITGTTGDITAVTAGNGLTGGGTSGDVTLNIGAANGINVTADAVGVTTGSTLTVDATGIHVNTANLTIATSQLTGTANLTIATSQLSGDVALGTQTSGDYVATITAGVGISGSSSGEGGAATIAVVANNGITANSTGVFARAANGISVDASGINVTGGNGLVANASGVHVVAANGISVDADSVGVTTGSTLTVNATGIHVNSALSITDLILSGNLDINGTLTTVDTTNLSVTDSIISLARGQNTASTLDIGFYGTFGNATTTSYSGLFRDATDNVYKLFSGAIPEPTTTVDTANSNFALANLSINSLTLTSALAAIYGGTGQSTYAAGDLLVANTGNTLSKLSLGTDGKVLQSNGTAVVYADLDGGTF
jgi:hypothetical protein